MVINNHTVDTADYFNPKINNNKAPNQYFNYIIILIIYFSLFLILRQ